MYLYYSKFKDILEIYVINLRKALKYNVFIKIENLIFIYFKNFEMSTYLGYVVRIPLYRIYDLLNSVLKFLLLKLFQKLWMGEIVTFEKLQIF